MVVMVLRSLKIRSTELLLNQYSHESGIHQHGEHAKYSGFVILTDESF
jgi:hypothetical protein